MAVICLYVRSLARLGRLVEQEFKNLEDGNDGSSCEGVLCDADLLPLKYQSFEIALSETSDYILHGLCV